MTFGRRLSETRVEAAHGGSGWRRALIRTSDNTGPVQELTHGTLPPSGCFDWHAHDGLHEIMFVIDGMGTVTVTGRLQSPLPRDDRHGTFCYGPGDVVFFLAGTAHKITASDEGPTRAVFIRYDATGPQSRTDDRREAIRDAIERYGALRSSTAAESEQGERDDAVGTQDSVTALFNEIISRYGPDDADGDRAVRVTLREYGVIRSAGERKHEHGMSVAAERLLTEVVDLCTTPRNHGTLYDAVQEYGDLRASEMSEYECGRSDAADEIAAIAHAVLLGIVDRYGQPR